MNDAKNRDLKYIKLNDYKHFDYSIPTIKLNIIINDSNNQFNNNIINSSTSDNNNNININLNKYNYNN